MVEAEKITHSVERSNGAASSRFQGVAQRQSLGGRDAPKRYHLRMDRNLNQPSARIDPRHVRAEPPEVPPIRNPSVVQTMLVPIAAHEDRRVQADAGLCKNCGRRLGWLKQPV